VARLFPRRASTTASAALLLLLSLFVIPTYADDDHNHLRERRDQVSHQLSARRADLDETSTALIKASARVELGAKALGAARDRLASVQRQVAAAERYDELMQLRLEQAIEKLRLARRDLDRGRRAVERQHRRVVAALLDDYQAGGPENFGIGFGFNTDSVQKAMSNIQNSRTAVDKQNFTMQRLQANQVLLRLTATRVKKAKVVVAETRRQAAANLEHKRRLEIQQEVVTKQVRERLQSLRASQYRLAVAKREEQAKIRELENERASLERRLRALALARARQHHTTVHRTVAPATSGGYLAFPANGPITSPYGMRLHPILHYWKLHDGTDFGIPCGTPVYAAAPGRITAEYYNGGYGNRVILDHGWVHGVSLQTSYNHLTSFVAHVGQRVGRGQLIAYSGTTGYSTGCHLHFMVYVNGGTVDPMSWL
jgi:murein DD-endopeptidase MepM/ murein hydrolase activator NlpD